MGNGAGKLNSCFSSKVSRRCQENSLYFSDQLDADFGHSFCYIRPDITKLNSGDSMVPLCTISGACISANTYTPLSTSLIDPFSCNNSSSLDKAASFESSRSFASVPLQPVPGHSFQSICSGPILGSGPVERGFLSGPIHERSCLSSPEGDKSKQLFKKWCIMKNLKKAISKSNVLFGGKKEISCSDKKCDDGNDLNKQPLVDDDDDEGDEALDENRSVEWAQGKAGEDRVHLVVSEERGWIFVGIYDGFSGPDATEFLLSNLYSNVYEELKGISWNDVPDSVANGVPGGSRRASPGFNRSVKHLAVLKALAKALKKTEESYLEITDMVLMDNPELAMMGSCVLVLLMKGDDVYLMNVGDSRAVLAQKLHLERIDEVRSTDLENFGIDAFNNISSLAATQLTVDHCTSVTKEVKRILREHLDDPSAITNSRVKGSLKITRAFGAGYLKKPKWNNALLESFRINYVGNSPYINCSPSFCHHRLGPKDRFLILSTDGLYQYFTNEQAVAQVEVFTSLFPEGDPAQHLVEEVLFRAAKKAGLQIHELLNIPNGERRKYHDDVSVIIISFEGRIWRSSL